MCSACESGYELNAGSNTCSLYCMENCLLCAISVSDVTCQSCLNNFYTLVNGVCTLSCETKLQKCVACNSDQTVCTQCTENYIVDPTTKYCQHCSAYMSGCMKCSSSTTCDQCQSGYYLASGLCSLCSTNSAGCLTCQS